MILPPGQDIERQRAFWTGESQRLVLAYFDIFLRHGFHESTSCRVIVAEDGFESVGLELANGDLGGSSDEERGGFAPEEGRISYDRRYPDYVLMFDVRSVEGRRLTSGEARSK